MTINVVCVFDPSPVYNVDYVHKLHAGIKRHLAMPHQFYCLTRIMGSMFEGDIHLLWPQSDWHGWWLKMELFRPGLLKGPILYFDLDTYITGRIDWLAKAETETILAVEDFYAPGRMASGVMRWDPSSITEDLFCHYRPHMNTRHGDQKYIGDRLTETGVVWESIQARYPNQIISYKKDFMRKRELDGVSIVCCHGSPKPHAINDQRLNRHWRL